jgi:hypothetical protein
MSRVAGCRALARLAELTLGQPYRESQQKQNTATERAEQPAKRRFLREVLGPESR